MSPDRELLARLDYEFKEDALYLQALTHRSASGPNNERLEFLGDAALGLVIAEALFRRWPDVPEGDLSRFRASLVKRETLAEVARDLDLGEYLRLGSGELKSGGYRRDSTLADGLEALFGAIYLDGGFAPCRSTILRLFNERLEHLPAAAALKDPKTRLQEYLQSRQLALPEYEVVESTGKDHDKVFRVECRVSALGCRVDARGSSRRRAEQGAADKMLRELKAE